MANINHCLPTVEACVMGLFDRILGRSQKVQDHGNRGHDLQVPDSKAVSRANDLSLVKLSGTTTFARESITGLARRHGAGEGGYLELNGELQREPDNPDPRAVAVRVEGDRVGYLPGDVARTLDLSTDQAWSVPVQIFTELVPKGLRAEAWVWLGPGSPLWEWTRESRPPMSSQAKAQALQEQVSEMVDAALAVGGDRARDFTSGMVNGIHYLELVEPIKQLKREQRLDEALVLCYAAIEGAEASAARERREPAPWYTEQAAIIHRKLGQHDEEVAVLERWVKACPPNRRIGSRVMQRLEKLRT